MKNRIPIEDLRPFIEREIEEMDIPNPRDALKIIAKAYVDEEKGLMIRGRKLKLICVSSLIYNAMLEWKEDAA